MSSRTDILNRIRQQTLPDAPLPDLQGDWIAFADREQQFADVLKFVGGRAEFIDRSELGSLVRGLKCFETAKKVICTVPGLDLSLPTTNLETVADPHDLADVDVTVLPGDFAVAENGAVWVTDQQIRHRTIYFITQHLVLVVPRSQIIDTMHQAYERLQFSGPSYGLFMSGPSKTADIEQSLVIGAHGPRSLTVIFV